MLCDDRSTVGRLLVLYPVQWLLGAHEPLALLQELRGCPAGTEAVSKAEEGGSEGLSVEVTEGVADGLTEWLVAQAAGLADQAATQHLDQVCAVARQVAVLLALAACAPTPAKTAAAAVVSTMRPCLEALATAYNRPYCPATEVDASMALVRAVLDVVASGPHDSRLRVLMLDELLRSDAFVTTGLTDYVEWRMDRLVNGEAVSDNASKYSDLIVGCLKLWQSSPEEAAPNAALLAMGTRGANVIVHGLLRLKKDTQAPTEVAALIRNTSVVNSLAALASLLRGGDMLVAAVCAAVEGGAVEGIAQLLQETLAFQLCSAEGQTCGGGAPSMRSRQGQFQQEQWGCISVLVDLLPVATLESQSMKTIIAAIASRLPEAFDVLAPGRGAVGVAKMLQPLFQMLQRILPTMASNEARCSTKEDTNADGSLVAVTLEAAWVAFEEVEKKPTSFLKVAVELFLHPCTFCISGSPVAEKFYDRLRAAGIRSTRVMAMVSIHCCRLWELHRIALQVSDYSAQLCWLCCYTNPQEEASQQSQRNSTVIDMTVGDALARGSWTVLPAISAAYPESFATCDGEHVVRLAAKTFIRRLGDSGEDGPAERQAARQLLADLLEVASEGNFIISTYAEGSDIWRRKVVLWQAVCAAVDSALESRQFVEESSAGEFEHQTLRKMIKAVERNECPAVRQCMDVVVIILHSRRPALIVEWLQPSIADFTLKPQVAQSLVVITGHVLLRLHKAERMGYFDQLFAPLLTWGNSNNRQLRAIAQMMTAMLLNSGWVEVSELMPQSQLQLNCLQTYLTSSPEGNAFCTKLLPHFEAFDPISLCRQDVPRPAPTAAEITAFGEDAEMAVAEWWRRRHFPLGLIEQLKVAFKGPMVMHEDGEDKRFDVTSWNAAAPEWLSHPDVSSEVENSLAVELEFQSKITPWEEDDESGSQQQLAKAEQAEWRIADRAKQSLVVVASLVEGEASLGGLARTGEIFNASKLVHILRAAFAKLQGDQLEALT
jgi:hypothetical protein